jgi:4-hydroxy-tetrahydrodipicolinate synthase
MRAPRNQAGWRKALATVSAVTVTPFRDDRVDEDGLRRNLEHVLAGGIRVLVAGGNTGEWASLSAVESIRVTRAHVAAADAARSDDGTRALVVAGVGGRTAEVVATGRACLEAGADALVLHWPAVPYLSEHGLLGWYREVAERLDGPLIPYVRGPLFTPAVAAGIAAIPSVVAVKYAVPDPRSFAACAAAANRLAWICGSAESWAPFFWPGGAVGFTSGLANVAPQLALDLLGCLRVGDRGRAIALWQRILPWEELRSRHGEGNNVGVVKRSLDLLGLCGGDPRPPLARLPAEDEARLNEVLREMEVLR